jgi:anti-sigma regulatory factor (Ser/Thr protein kinase)/anti-anti-sigma regulatory factor
VTLAARFGGAPLAIQVIDLPPYVVGQWIGAASDTTLDIVAQGCAELLARPAEHVVLDFGRLGRVEEAATLQLARSLQQAQRMGRTVWLVRCPDDLFRCFQRHGVAGAVMHAGSLLAATQGLAGQPASTLDLHLRSAPELLRRLRSVVSALATRASLSEESALQLRAAVTEAAANAIVHGSPEGSRNHVRVSFHLERDALIVDVADQGPGFDPVAVPSPVPTDLREHGYGLHLIRESMDRVEFYRDDRGMLVRMTKFLAPSYGEIV